MTTKRKKNNYLKPARLKRTAETVQDPIPDHLVVPVQDHDRAADRGKVQDHVQDHQDGRDQDQSHDHDQNRDHVQNHVHVQDRDPVLVPGQAQVHDLAHEVQDRGHVAVLDQTNLLYLYILLNHRIRRSEILFYKKCVTRKRKNIQLEKTQYFTRRLFWIEVRKVNRC